MKVFRFFTIGVSIIFSMAVTLIVYSMTYNGLSFLQAIDNASIFFYGIIAMFTALALITHDLEEAGLLDIDKLLRKMNKD